MHIPVLQKEVLQYLSPKPNENFIDCTIGGAGHALAILELVQPRGKLLGIDWDEEIISSLKLKTKKLKLKNRLILINDSFTNLKKIVEREKFGSVSGILFDLGMSSWHLEESEKGFSFSREEPLDMRYNLGNPLTAQKIVNYWSWSEIEKTLKIYGEERYAKRIARKIIETRKIKPIKTTFQLVGVIKKAIPPKYRHGRIHFSTRTFQALRIAVNDELNNLETALPQALETLKPGGKIVVISFHSLEDRIVKNFFRKQSKEGSLKILTKKPIGPTREEIKINPRSRSAKLRAATRLV